jgi:low temperature requirement protein LtrA
MKTVSSRSVPWSHCTGITAILAGFIFVPYAENFLLQLMAAAILLAVALWEYIALRRFRRASA